jgi:molybdopterin molybdotransferase
LEVNAAGQPLARPCGAQASSRIASLQDADLLLEIPADAANLDVDSELWAQLLRLPIF